MKTLNLSPTAVSRRRGIVSILALLLAIAGISLVLAPPSTAGVTGIFPDDLRPRVAVDPDRRSVELGIRFSPDRSGEVTALQYYQGYGADDVTEATLWSARGRALATVSFSESRTPGWRTVPLSDPVALEAGSDYVVSYFAPQGGYPTIEFDLMSGREQNGFSLPDAAGVYAYADESTFPTRSYLGSNYLVDVVYRPDGVQPPTTTSTTSEPPTSTSTTSEPPTSTSTTTQPPTTTSTTTQPPTTTTRPPTTTSTTTQPSTTTTTTRPPTTTTTTTSTPTSTPSPTTTATGGFIVLGRSFPSSATTGVPAGTALTDYTGPCSIQTDNVVIDSKRVNCDLRILAQGITIRNSVLNGSIYSDPDYFNGSFTLTDSEVRMPLSTGTGIGDVNFVVTRVEVTGGSRSINCAANCTVQDSYLHGQYTDRRGIDHESAIRMGAGSIIRHNTITCDATPVPPDAGCSAGLTGYGDFAIVQKNTIDNNLIDGGPFGSMGYCAYGGSTTGKPYSAGVNNIKFTNNIFKRGPNGKCGIWGPITSFDSNAPGNVWTNNLWDDGATVPPAN